MKAILKFKTKAEIEYLIWLIESNHYERYYYGNKEQFEKRQDSLMDRLTELLKELK